VQVDLFSAKGELPANLDQVLEREKDIRYSSKTRFNTKYMMAVESLRLALGRFMRRMPAELHEDPDYKLLWPAVEKQRQITIAHLINRRLSHSTNSIHLLGELGIALLLFTLGLEFSIPQFLAMRRPLLVLGGSQVIIGTFSGAAIALLLGLPWESALVVGGALAMSSTAIVVKQLRDQLELQTAHGRLAIGILLFQDIAAIPFLVAIPIFARTGAGDLGVALAFAAAKAIAAATLMLALGRYVLRPLLREAGRSRELFTLTTLLLSLAAAWASAWIGLSLAFGAFIAGMMLSETEYRHQIEEEIRTFRDVLLGLFFIVVGMQLQPALLPAAAAWIALLVTGLVVGKAAIMALIARLYGYGMPEAFRAGLVIAQGGEFSVALLALALSTGLFTVEASQPVLAAIIVSMLIAPILIKHNGTIVARLCRPQQVRVESQDAAGATSNNPVLVCGYGRVGRQFVHMLAEQGLACIAIENDPDRVQEGRNAGEKVFYGDATRRGVLEAAGLARARALVVSFDDLTSALQILQQARELNPDVPVLARAANDAALDALLSGGATDVVPETMETSLMLTSQLLLLLGAPPERVLAHMHAVRSQQYRLLKPRADSGVNDST
jgi:monovalent cation:H+ antiporter-2, CPA2 family